MERRLCESEVRIDRKGGGQKISGTAAVYYREGDKGTEYDLAGYGMPGVKERIMPGAFKRALGRGQGGNRDRGQDIYAAINHDPSLVFARTKAGTLKLKVDDNGLHYEATPSDTTAGRDAIANVEAGNFGGSSFAFQVAKNGERWVMDGKTEVREITKISAIVDVSPVTTPAYKSTSVNSRAAEHARASYEQWKKQLTQDFSDLDEINDLISAKMPRQEEDEAEAPEPVDGECPDGWEYDEESDTCVKLEVSEDDEGDAEEEAPADEEADAYRGASMQRLISSNVPALRSIVSFEESEDTITIVFAKAKQEEEAPADDSEVPDDVSEEEASREKYNQRARAALIRLKIFTD